MKRFHGFYLRTIFLYAVFLAVSSFFYGCGKLPVEHQVISAEGSEIKIPAGGMSDGKVHFFTYRHSGKRINFFVRTDGAGRLSTYFDACFTCNKHKKGYRCEGTDLICNECDTKFKLADERWDDTHGCSPIMLSSSTDKDFIVIKTADIEKGARLF